MGVYALFIAGANFAAPIMSGFINDDQGWQWVLVRSVGSHVCLHQDWLTDGLVLVCNIQRRSTCHSFLPDGGNQFCPTCTCWY